MLHFVKVNTFGQTYFVEIMRELYLVTSIFERMAFSPEVNYVI